MAFPVAQITKRQKDALQVLHRHINSSGFPPSFVELKDELGISSNQSLLDLLRALEEKKCIKRSQGAARAIRILKNGFRVLGVGPLIPMVGETAGGPVLEAIEQADTWKELGQEIEQLDQVFFVRIKGDSMINVGIDNGDVVLVKESKEFTSGKIVLAETPYGTTLKRFIVQNKSPYRYLKPENPRHDIIIFTKNMRLRAIALKAFKQNGSIVDLK